MTQVCVVGLGYIGLPTAALLASRGHRVLGVDVKKSTIDKVNAGEIPIFEPDLEDLVHSVVKQGSLRAAAHPERAEVYLIAVPTPFCDGFVPDISFVEAACDSITPHLEPGSIVILESTSPVGTTSHLQKRVLEKRPDLRDAGSGTCKVHFAYGPERVLPGRILTELRNNDRVVGGVDPVSAEKAAAFYRTLTEGEVFVTNAATAEMTKLTENAFRDVNIAFANEISRIAEKSGVNPWELIRLANRHPRVNILQPGPGVGGHCIAVDPWFLVHAAPQESRLIRTAREVNLAKTEHVYQQILAAMDRHPGAKLAYLGLAYKPDIDDVRESPALEILEKVLHARPDREILVVEPHLSQLPASLSHPRAHLVELEKAIADAPLVALLVDHKAFRAVPSTRLRGKTVIDTRGVWEGSSDVRNRGALPTPAAGATA